MSAFLVLGATCGKVSVNGLNTSSVQGDKKIIELLREIGCSLTIDRLKITTKKSRLSSFVFDAQDCPDLVPYVSVLGALADGMSVITNVERLALKESDRILSTLEMLRAFNITASSDGHAIAIYGGTPTAGVIDSFNDHRIVMAAAILSCVCGGTIENERAVEKSYPNFFEHLRAVGGKTSNA
jgi:3-phosphoshikimate 1-carboxyvinyltransferase